MLACLQNVRGMRTMHLVGKIAEPNGRNGRSRLWLEMTASKLNEFRLFAFDPPPPDLTKTASTWCTAPQACA